MRYEVEVRWREQTRIVTVEADGPDEAFSADIGAELPEEWPDEGWEILGAWPAPYERS